jgi:hypothetical protein
VWNVSDTPVIHDNDVGELDYHFWYELRFEDESGEVLRPTTVFSRPPCNDDMGINDRLVTDSLFQTDRLIVCLELLAVYRGTVQVKAAIAANPWLFAHFGRHTRTLSTFHRSRQNSAGIVYP